MTQPKTSRWRWLLWLAYLAAWTCALVMPIPPTEGLPGHEIISARRFAIAKTIHLLVYASVAALTGWLHAPPRYRLLLVFFLMAHGTATELLQMTFTEAGLSQRTGTLFDACVDHVGVLLGLLATWRWWTREG